MKIVQEFREFAVKGSVVDMAVGIIIGAAFTGIARSLIDDVLMPPIGVLLGGVSFHDYFVVLKPGVESAPPYPTLQAARDAGAVTLNYGQFINTLLTFLLTAVAVFILVRTINRLRREEQLAPQAPTERACPYCAMPISVRAVRCPHCTSEVQPAT